MAESFRQKVPVYPFTFDTPCTYSYGCHIIFIKALVASYYKLHATGENLSARGRPDIDAAECIFTVLAVLLIPISFAWLMLKVQTSR